MSKERTILIDYIKTHNPAIRREQPAELSYESLAIIQAQLALNWLSRK